MPEALTTARVRELPEGTDVRIHTRLGNGGGFWSRHRVDSTSEYDGRTYIRDTDGWDTPVSDGEVYVIPKCEICKLWGMDVDAVGRSTWEDGNPVDLCRADANGWHTTLDTEYTDD